VLRRGYPCRRGFVCIDRGPQHEYDDNFGEVKMAKAPAKKASTKKEPARRRTRAKKADGTFMADDPSTPDVNEAFIQDDPPAPPAPEVQREAQRAVGGRYLGGKLIG